MGKEKSCLICKTNFGIFTWRYNCQSCNSVVCSNCFVKNQNNCINCVKEECSGCKKIFKNKFLINESIYKLCKECHSDFKTNQNHWISGTKNEYLKGYKIVKEIGYVEINIKCDSPNKVEELLISKCVILGANSYIKFFWKKHFVSEPETDTNFSAKGNIYYTTKYNKYSYFTGSAIAVIVESTKR